jgi:hypothetical protein
MALSLAACAVDENLVLDGQDDADVVDGKADRAGDKTLQTFYTVRPDTRKCASPECGGFWVKRARRATTPCADGSSASECYVADIDFAAIGLAADDIAWLRGAPELLVIRGNLAKRTFSGKSLGALQAEEAWRASGAGTVDGPFYLVEDLGIRCITTPCFSLHASRLNSSTSYTVSGLAGPLADQAGEMMYEGHLLVTGSVKRAPHAGPGGEGRTVDVNEYFTKVEAQPAACRTAEDCEITAYSRPVRSAGDCYCPACADAVVNRTTAAANQASWEKFCSNVRLACSATTCVAARASCERETCGIAE